MAILYVKSGSTGNGSAWNNAYGSLQSAITAAQAGDEIWVAAGTYKPTTGTDRTASFTLKNNVGIYGGFTGTETALNQRNIANNITILSGEIGAAGIADNSYHVISATGNVSNPLTNSAILDGFTDLQGALSRIKLAKKCAVWLGILISLEFTSSSASAAIFNDKTTFEAAASIAGNLALETFDSFTGPILQLSSLGITFNPMNAGIQPHSILVNCPGPTFSSPNALVNNNACSFPGRGSIVFQPMNPSNGIVGVGFFNTGGDDTLQLSAFDASNNLIEQATVSGSNLNPNSFKFLGIVTSIPASRIEISPVGGNGLFSIDNLQVATKSIQSVPEPSIILGLVTLGLGALFSKKHKQDDNNDD
jgi:hypothetical protein